MLLNVFLERSSDYLVRQLDVHPGMLIDDLKNLLCYIYNIPPQNQVLECGGKILKDKKALAEYSKIMRGEMLTLIESVHPKSQNDVLESLIWKHIEPNYSTEDTAKILSEFNKEFYRSVTEFSLDDYENTAKSMLANEKPKNQ